MKKQKKKQNGITLIALVISIIVMLILAGVSLNMTVGDNGIISQAQQATYAQSCAMLEEYLQQYYVQNFERMESVDGSKVVILQNLKPGWFFSTNLGYIPDSNGNALYLINKSGLPNEIKNELKGGEAGDGTYSSYANLIDVYGVTSDLRVYYCSNGLDTVFGIEPDGLDQDDATRVVASSTSNSIGASLLAYDGDGDGKISAQEARSVKTATINGQNLTDLSEIGSLSSLQTLVLNNATLANLSGIEKCSKLYYIYFKSCTIQDYSALNELRSQMTHLILVDVDDQELTKFCSKDKGIGSGEFTKLTNLAITANSDTTYMFNTSGWSDDLNYSYIRGARNVTKYVTSLAPLSNLTTATKNAVKYLCVSANELTSLSGIQDFNNLNMIRAERNKIADASALSGKKSLTWVNFYSNKLTGLTWITSANVINYMDVMYNEITTLKGVGNDTNLVRLLIGNNQLGKNLDSSIAKNTSTDALADITACTKLYVFEALNNSNLVWVDYLKNISTLKYLYLNGCTSMDSTSLAALKTIINASYRVNFPSKYELALIDKDTVNLKLSNQTITENVFESLIPQYEGTTLVSGLGNISKLELYNLTFTKSNGTKLTAAEANTLLVKVLSSLKTLNDLRVVATSADYSTASLSSDSFFGAGKVSHIVELNLHGVSLPNLSNLNSCSSSLRTLILVGNRATSFDFSTMQDAINNINSNRVALGERYSVFEANYRGLAFDTTVASSFVGLTRVTGLYLSFTTSSNATVDLSGFTSLTSVYGYRWFSGSTVLKLPKSLTSFSLNHPAYAYEDFSECTSLTYIDLNDHADFNYSDLYNTCLSIKKLFENAAKEGKTDFSLSYFRIQAPWYGTVPSFDFLSPLSGLKIYGFEANFGGDRNNITDSSGLGYLNKTRYITIYGTLFNVLKGLTPVYNESGTLVKGCPDLETFTCGNGNNLADISDLGGCTKLKNITVYNCSVSNIYGFQNLSNLEYCYLRNNSLMNSSSYIDANGKSQNYNVLEIFANLNTNAKLKKLHISGNSFDTLTTVSGLTWLEKDF